MACTETIAKSKYVFSFRFDSAYLLKALVVVEKLVRIKWFLEDMLSETPVLINTTMLDRFCSENPD